MSSLPDKLGKFIRLSWQDKLLFFEAWFRLGAARFAILTVPFAKLAADWGEPMYESLRETPPDRELVKGVKRAIARASRYTPWKSNCLPQAITGKHMLQKHGLHSTLYLGLMHAPSGDLAAHAWLRCGDVYVTGGRGARFTVVGTFTETDTSVNSASPTSEISTALAWLKDE